MLIKWRLPDGKAFCFRTIKRIAQSDPYRSRRHARSGILRKIPTCGAPFFSVRLPATIIKTTTMFVDVLGYVAGAITALTFLPQVIKTGREKSAKDISLLMFVIAAINEIMWIVYGALLDNWVIILTNSVVLAMSLTMIFLKFRYNR